MTVVLFVCLLSVFFATISMPIAYALGFAALGATLLFTDIPLFLVGQKIVGGIDSFTLLAIPFFLLAAEIMNTGGITQRILDVFNGIFGALRGALGLASVGANMFLAGISGSAVADATATSSVLIPSMKKSGYPPAFAAAICAVAAICGPIIPPSIPLVIYGVVARVSIIKLFVAGYLPGLALCLGLFAYVWIAARARNFPAETRIGMGELGSRVRRASWGLAIPVLLLVGILGGVFTITELGAVLVVYALAIAMFVHRSVNSGMLWKGAVNTVLDTANIMFIVGVSSFFAYLLALQGVPDLVASYIAEHVESRIAILLIVNLAFLLAGMFLDSTPATIILVPILLPIMREIGVDPVQFGMIAVFNLMIGLITPPVALTLFIAARVAGVSISRTIIETVPMFVLLIAILGLITFVPEFTLWLPRALGY